MLQLKHHSASQHACVHVYERVRADVLCACTCACVSACTVKGISQCESNVHQSCSHPYVLGQTREEHEPILCMYVRMYVHTISRDMSIVMEIANCFASSNVIGGGDGVGVGVGSISTIHDERSTKPVAISLQSYTVLGK